MEYINLTQMDITVLCSIGAIFVTAIALCFVDREPR